MAEAKQTHQVIVNRVEGEERALKAGSWKTNKQCDLILRGSRRNVLLDL